MVGAGTCSRSECSFRLSIPLGKQQHSCQCKLQPDFHLQYYYKPLVCACAQEEAGEKPQRVAGGGIRGSLAGRRMPVSSVHARLVVR